MNDPVAYQALYDVEGAYGFYKPVLPQRVTCSGSEQILRDCSFQYTTWCDSALSETAGVKCAENAVCMFNDHFHCNLFIFLLQLTGAQLVTLDFNKELTQAKED